MHSSVTCRPDISYAVGALSRHLVHPQDVHIKAAERVLQYLRTTADWSLCYGKLRSSLTFYGCCDASHAAIDFRGISGYHFNYSGGAVSWKAVFQKSISHSSTESELIALDSAVREAVYLKKLLQDFRISADLFPVTIGQDNTSTMILANAGHFNQRTKHLSIRLLYANELINEGVVCLKYIRTSEMSADVLTKPLYAEDHKKHARVLLGHADVDLMAEQHRASAAP